MRVERLGVLHKEKRCRSAGAKGTLFGKGVEQDFAPLELHQYASGLVSERQRGTAKNSVSASLRVQNSEQERNCTAGEQFSGKVPV